MALSTFGLGISYYYVGDIDSAIKYNELALERFRELKDTFRIAAIINNLGVFYNQLGLYEESINQYFASLKIKENIKDTNGLAKVYNNIGSLYHRWGKPDEAIEMFKESLKYNKLVGDSADIYELYRNFGITYFSKLDPKFNIENFEDGTFTRNQLINTEIKFINELDSTYIDTAKYYFQLAKEGFEKLKDTSNLARVWISNAYLEYNLGNQDNAEKLYKRSLKYLLESKQYYDYSRATLALVDISILRGDYQSAEYYLKKTEEIVDKIDFRFMRTQIYELKAILNSKKGNYKEAYNFSLKFIALKDSLFNEKSLNAIEEIEKKYQLEQKDAQLKIANQKAEVLNQQRYILVISIVFLILIAILLTHRYFYKQNINKILRQKMLN